MPFSVAALIPDWEALDVLAMYPGGRPEEASVHAFLREYRLDGEWFQLGPSRQAVNRVDAAYQRAVSLDDEPLTAQGRKSRGSVGGGQWLTTAAQVRDLVGAWCAAGRPEGDPLRGFEREQLRRVARDRGLMTRRRRGLARDQIAALLVDDIASKIAVTQERAVGEAVQSGAARDYEQFCAWVRAGFTEDQALRMIAASSAKGG